MTDKQDGQYTYDPKSRRFRGPDGRYVSAARIVGLRETIVTSGRGRVALLVDRLYAGTLTPNGFVLAMRDQIKRTTVMEYMLGRGGVNMLTQADYGRMGAMLKPQYQYLNNFTRQIVDGEVTKAQALRRADMYIDSTRVAHERGKARSWDVNLPAYPGIHPGCACEVDMKEVDNAVHAYWRTRSANPCPDCEGLESEWNPLVIER